MLSDFKKQHGPPSIVGVDKLCNMINYNFRSLPLF